MALLARSRYIEERSDHPFVCRSFILGLVVARMADITKITERV
jgi:hypothetical protein